MPLIASAMQGLSLAVAHTWTAIQTFVGIDQSAGIIRLNALVKRFIYLAIDDAISPWTFTDVAGTNTNSGIIDGIDGGHRITTGTTANDKGSLGLNNIRNFDPANCRIYGIVRRNTAATLVRVGITDNNSDISDEAVNLEEDTNRTNKALVGRDAGGATVIETDIVISTAITPFKIICGASNQELFLIESGAWVLKATQSTRLPTDANQPFFAVATSDTNASTGDMLYLEVFNAS